MKNEINQTEVCKACTHTSKKTLVELVEEIMMVKQMIKTKKLEPPMEEETTEAKGNVWSVGRDGDHHELRVNMEQEDEEHPGWPEDQEKLKKIINPWWN